MVAVTLFILFPAIIISSLLDLTSQDPHSSSHHLLTQLHEANLKVAQLESSVEKIIQKVKASDSYLQSQEKQIQDMEKMINHLRFTLSNLKTGSPLIDERINVLEEEVRALWATSRKNNFDIYVLRSRAEEAEDRLQIKISHVDKMADVVSEQWIQIQQFEQALQLRQMNVLKAQRRVGHPRCSFLKLINELFSNYLPESVWPLDSHSFVTSRSFISQTLNHLKRLYSAMKKSHHELQGLIRREMERHEFAAFLVNEELVFFVASALIISPLFGAWLLLSSKLH